MAPVSLDGPGVVGLGHLRELGAWQARPSTRGPGRASIMASMSSPVTGLLVTPWEATVEPIPQ